jgi:hypothetical protein
MLVSTIREEHRLECLRTMHGEEYLDLGDRKSQEYGYKSIFRA